MATGHGKGPAAPPPGVIVPRAVLRAVPRPGKAPEPAAEKAPVASQASRGEAQGGEGAIPASPPSPASLPARPEARVAPLEGRIAEPEPAPVPEALREEGARVWKEALDATAPAGVNLTHAAQVKGAAVIAAGCAERIAYAETLFTAGPDLDPKEVNAQIAARFGVALNSTALYQVRREVRARLGLAPASGTRTRNRIEPAAPSLPAMVAGVEAPLPPEVVSAQAALVAALRRSGVVSSYCLTFVGGEAEVEHEVEVRRTAKGKTSL
jgi:hypothetical protein